MRKENEKKLENLDGEYAEKWAERNGLLARVRFLNRELKRLKEKAALIKDEI